MTKRRSGQHVLQFLGVIASGLLALGAGPGPPRGGSFAAGHATLGTPSNNGLTIRQSPGRITGGNGGHGSGKSTILDLHGDGFMQIAVPPASRVPNGRMRATGGAIQPPAVTVQEAVHNGVNISSALLARSLSGHSGSIVLGGGGNAAVSGRLNASAGRMARARRQTAHIGTFALTGHRIAIAAKASVTADRNTARKTAKGGTFANTGPSTGHSVAIAAHAGAAGKTAAKSTAKTSISRLAAPLRRPPKTGESGPGLYEHRLIGGFLSGRPASISF